MTLETKKKIIYNTIKTGMELKRAFLLAECSDEDIEQIESDEEFMTKIDKYQVYAERKMLELHAKACQIAATKGNTTGMQWKLGKLNPDRWGEKKTDILIPGKLVIDGDDKGLL